MFINLEIIEMAISDQYSQEIGSNFDNWTDVENAQYRWYEFGLGV
jgi:hypothetical protein